MSDTAKVFTTPQLVESARVGRSRRYNATLNPAQKDQLDPDGVHVVAQHFLHESGQRSCVRCTMLLKLVDKEAPVTATIDVPLDHFNAVAERDLP